MGRLRRYLEQRGYGVRIVANALARGGHTAGSPQMRADGVNDMLRDPAVRMIMTSTGGSGAAHLLPLLDYDAMARAPRLIVGLSNPAILLNAITAMTGVPTFHGPNGYNMGHTRITPFSESNFWPLVAGETPIPHEYPVANDIRVLRSGAPVEGRLFGGHLGTIQGLIGTPWAPDWRGALLFVEEIGVDLARIDAMLTHLRLAGVFEVISGLVVGQLVDCQEATDDGETLEDVIMRACADYAFPIVCSVPLGHTEDKITLPIGVMARLDAARPSLALVESPTR
jgi:muramoyltetrapeptide carboxypeptidase